MLESVVDKWSPDFHMTAFYHDFTPKNLPKAKNITYRNLNEVQDMVDFKETYASSDGTNGGKFPYSWRLDTLKFCHKVFALTELAFEMAEKEADAGWLCWLDADTITNKLFKKKHMEFLNEEAELYYLGRPHFDYSETSFLAFNLSRQPPLDLLGDLRGAYISGEVLTYREWHDGFVFERLLNIYNAHGLRSIDLTGSFDIKSMVKGKQAFELSPLGGVMKHDKGTRKKQDINKVSYDVPKDLEGGPKRYRQLADLVRHYSADVKKSKNGLKCFSIAETGTYNGGRAIEMALCAFETVDQVIYTGYDLFEEATEELDKIELNTKPHNTLASVEARLTDFAEIMKTRQNKIFKFDLRKGNTKDTLENDPCELDLVFIDGGHSAETVDHDYRCLINSPVVILDDFFSTDLEGKIPEEHMGVNELFDKIVWRKRVLPSNDLVKGGGCTHLALILTNDDVKDPPTHLFKQPILVKPQDSVPKEHIHKNVKANMKLIDKWLERGSLNKDTAIIISAGPSTDYEELRSVMEDKPDHELVCVKHSYPKLVNEGFIPDSCVILDPREIDGTSTHGIIRKELFKNKINDHTKFLIASMTDESVTNYLLENDANIIGWHAFSAALQDQVAATKDTVSLREDLEIPTGTTLITGGTCAAMRAIGMYHTLGFRDFHLFGFDCSFTRKPTKKQLKETSEDGKPKYLQVDVKDKKYWTTGELLAMAQDCERLFSRDDVEMDIKFHGKKNLVRALWDIRPQENLRNYKEFMK
jgi:hypothetical protein